jgi:hypothetical protein
MDGEHEEHVEHVKNSAEGAGQDSPAANAPNTPNTPRKPKWAQKPKGPQKWSELRREEKALIAEAAVRRFDVYVAEHGNKPYSRAIYSIADEVCAAVRESGITLPKRIVESHAVKFLAKLAKGGSRFEVKMRKAPANERDGDVG